MKVSKLNSGLYFIATPIGAARDITLRALDILASADVIVAEDTRSMRRLMDIHGIALKDRPLLSFHDHSPERVKMRVLSFLDEGKSVAYGSEAGTPMIADPGYELSKSTAEAGHLVVSAPGPSAVITALTLAGLPTDRFLFSGFLPNRKAQRISALETLRDVPATLVFYESPKRVAAMLEDAREVLGDRNAALCRELTKKFEETLRGTLSDLALQVSHKAPKGEIVVVIDRGHQSAVNSSDLESDLRWALQTQSVRDAADIVAKAHGLARRKVYQMALELDRNDNEKSE